MFAACLLVDRSMREMLLGQCSFLVEEIGLCCPNISILLCVRSRKIFSDTVLLCLEIRFWPPIEDGLERKFSNLVMGLGRIF